MLEHSKTNTIAIAHWIDNDLERFAQLIDIVISGEDILAQRAAWVLSHITDDEPQMAEKFVPALIHRAQSPGHVAVRRSITRLLQHCPLGDEEEGLAYDMCLNFARSARENIAVRVFSLSVLARIAAKYEELRPEVFSLAKDFIQSESPGMRSRGRKVIDMFERSKQG